MRIESATNIISTQASKNTGSEARNLVQNAVAVAGRNEIKKTNDEYNYEELSKKTKFQLSLDETAWIEMIEKANKAIIGATCCFEYSIHEATKEIMVKVINKDTKEVIREIPPEKILDMVAKMWEMAGIIVDERR